MASTVALILVGAFGLCFLVFAFGRSAQKQRRKAITGSRVNFQVPHSRGELFRVLGGGEGNLEDAVMFWDFYRGDPEWSNDEPLVMFKDFGLGAFFTMRGVDPESFGQDVFDKAAESIRRAMDTLSLESLEEGYKGGTWEIGNTLMRIRIKAPALAPLKRHSVVMEYLNKKNEQFWNSRDLMDDRIVWWVKYCPRVKSKTTLWSLRGADYYASQSRLSMNRQASMVRRAIRNWQESMMAFTTPRPEQSFGLNWMSAEKTFEAMFTMVNRGLLEVPEYNESLSLVTQVCLSTRENFANRRHLRINDMPSAVLTFKMPPKMTEGACLSVFQDKCRFPFFLSQTWEPVSGKAQSKTISINHTPAETIAKKSKLAQEWLEEADDYLKETVLESATPFNWRWTAVVVGSTEAELEERVNRLRTWVKTISGAEPLTEGVQARGLAEMACLPGGSFANERKNIVTSHNAGESAMVYRLDTGSEVPHLVFANRRNGTYGYDLFSGRLPNWNAAILGGPGTGKSVLANLALDSLVGYPSQAYVVDLGNSYSRTFEWLGKELGSVQTMRFQSNEFKFNPLPLVWALEEKRRQIEAGQYLMDLGDGVILPCPVKSAKTYFESFLECLLTEPGKLFSPAVRNRLQKALYGAGEAGDGGFFRHFETVCDRYLERSKAGEKVPLPRPLTELLIHVRSEVPELSDALELWTRGERALYFDSGEDVFSEAKAIYFELTGLDDQKSLAAPFVAAVMGGIWRKIIDPRFIHEKKIVLIDEAWKFLGDPAFAAQIEMMFRTIRKFGGCVWLMSQTPDDLKTGDAIKLLRSMSHIFLYPGFYDEDLFKKHLQMTDAQVELYVKLRGNDQVHEILHWEQTGRVQIFDVKLDPWRYWVKTSEAMDKSFWAHYIRYTDGNELDAIEHLANACGCRTIPNKELRHKLVIEYAHQNGVDLGGVA